MRHAAVLFLLAIVTVTQQLDSTVILGAELGETERQLGLGSFSETSNGAQSLSGFVGFDLGNSVLYIAHRDEEQEFLEGLLAYGRTETSVEWHWNEDADTNKTASVSFGLFRTVYDIGSIPDEEFFGFSLGVAGAANLVGERMFILGSFKVKLPYTDDPKFLEESEDSRFFVGYEGRVATGVYLWDSSVAIMIGYRYQQIDFDNVFVDDESQGAFVAVRFVIPTE